MRTLRRLSLYAVLMVPIAYVMGLTFAERRMENYRRIAVGIGPLVAAYLLHRAGLRWFAPYRRWVDGRGGWARRMGHGVAQIALLAMLVAPAFVLIPIGMGLMPAAYLTVAAALGAALAAQRMLGRRWPAWMRLDPPLVLLLLIFATLVEMVVTILGSSDRACATVATSPYLVPIITREEIRRSGVVDSCFPYDVKSDAAADKLFFTLKQKRSGFVKTVGEQEIANDAIGVTSLSAPWFEASSLITIRGASTGRYAQRITVNPARKEMYVVVLDIDGRHTIRVVSYAAGFHETRALDLDYEPIRVFFHNERGNLIVLGYEGSVGVFDIDTYERRLFREYDLGMIGLLDTLVPTADGGAYYASVVNRNFLLIDSTDFHIRRMRAVGVPTIGLDYDAATNRVYAAGTLTREILVLDGETLDVLDRIPAGVTVRELTLDRRRGLIVTAGYTEGFLDLYDLATYSRRARLFVGKLARGVHLEPESSRVFVTSSCGLFEVRVDALLAGAQSSEPGDLPPMGTGSGT